MFFYVMLLSFILGIIVLVASFKVTVRLVSTLLFLVGFILIAYAVFLAFPHQGHVFNLKQSNWLISSQTVFYM